MSLEELRSPVARVAGSSGAAGLAAGDRILQIRCHASVGGAVLAMPDGRGGTATVPIPNGAQWFTYDARHTNFSLKNSEDLTFTGTDAFFVEYTNPGGVT